MPDQPALLEVKDLVKHFPLKKGFFARGHENVYAVDGVSFSVHAGETLGIVGESGCGKSTTARMIVKLVEPTSGSIRLDGTDITHFSAAEMWAHRRRVQFIFQDP